MSIFRLLSLLGCLMMVCTCLLLASYDPRAVVLRDAIMQRLQLPLQFAIYKQKEAFHYKQSLCQHSKAVDLTLPDLSMADHILQDLDHHHLAFLLETSGKSQLTVRQACAVESAARSSGRNVVLLMTAVTVSVCVQKMASLLVIPNLLVLHLNTSLLVSNTPLQPMFDDGRVNKTCCKTIHYSDIFRMAALFRYG